MDEIQRGYDDAINRVIELTYLDLVDAMIERRETEKKMRDAPNEHLKMYWKDEREKAQKEVEKWSEWFLVVIPRYRNLDGERFVKWAAEEAEQYERTGYRRNHKSDATT